MNVHLCTITVMIVSPTYGLLDDEWLYYVCIDKPSRVVIPSSTSFFAAAGLHEWITSSHKMTIVEPHYNGHLWAKIQLLQ